MNEIGTKVKNTFEFAHYIEFFFYENGRNGRIIDKISNRARTDKNFRS